MGNDTVKKFQEKQNKAHRILMKLKGLIDTGIEIGVDIDSALKRKLEKAIELVEKNSRLRIALVGGFSEGKTSIVATWMEQYDKETMRISQEESSNAVQVYTNSDIELVDTPGLFGFKEEFNNEINEFEKYKDITKKYISEAHLILYIMNPENPIKESHKAVLNWMFRSLELLPRTVFVLSRFDEVSDVADERDYGENLKIKKISVISRLKSMIQLTAEEESLIQVVGVSANPFGRGTEYWLNHLDELKKFSRIDTLQRATDRVIENNHGAHGIVYKVKRSILNDILIKEIPKAKELGSQIDTAVNRLDESRNLAEKKMESIEYKIITAQSNLVKSITRYFSDLITQVRGCGIETMQSFLDAEIGKDGSIMNAKIQDIFRTEVNIVNVKIKSTALEFKANFDHFDSTVKNISRQGLNFLKNSQMVNSQNIKIVRDCVVNLGTKIGVDLSKVLRFKPWGTVKLAKNLGIWLQGISLALELMDSYKRAKAEEKFRKDVNDLVESLEDIRKELLDLVQEEQFSSKFFPDYVILKESLEQERHNIEIYKDKQQRFRNWYKEVEVINLECRTLN